MSTHWKAGDKAVCVIPFIGRMEVCRLASSDPMPVLGNTYLVESVRPPIGKASEGLYLAGMNSILPFVSYKFRKVVTATEREAIGMERLLKDVLP